MSSSTTEQVPSTTAVVPMDTGVLDNHGTSDDEQGEAGLVFEPLADWTMENIVDALIASSNPLELYKKCTKVVEVLGRNDDDRSVVRIAKNKLADDPVRLCELLASLDICFGYDCWGKVYETAGLDALQTVLASGCCKSLCSNDIAEICSTVKDEDSKAVFASLAKMGPEMFGLTISQFIEDSYERAPQPVSPEKLFAILDAMLTAEVDGNSTNYLTFGLGELTYIVSTIMLAFDEDTDAMCSALAKLASTYCSLYYIPSLMDEQSMFVFEILTAAEDYLDTHEWPDAARVTEQLVTTLGALADSSFFFDPVEISRFLTAFQGNQLSARLLCKVKKVELSALIDLLGPEEKDRFSTVYQTSKKRSREPEDDGEQSKRHRALPGDE